MSQDFVRQRENFTCGQCGRLVRGNGYTNHCPNCLWSRHVDVFPGDRQATCHGLMKPIDLKTKGNGFVLAHCCLSCGVVKSNRTVVADNLDSFLATMIQ